MDAECMEMKGQQSNIPKSMGCSKCSSKKEVYSHTGLPLETRKISNEQSKIISKGTRKRTNGRPKSVEGRK